MKWNKIKKSTRQLIWCDRDHLCTCFDQIYFYACSSFFIDGPVLMQCVNYSFSTSEQFIIFFSFILLGNKHFEVRNSSSKNGNKLLFSEKFQYSLLLILYDIDLFRAIAKYISLSFQTTYSKQCGDVKKLFRLTKFKLEFFFWWLLTRLIGPMSRNENLDSNDIHFKKKKNSFHFAIQ